MLERFITEKEAAQITGYSVYWFQQKRWKGGGPPYRKIGHAVRYYYPDLMKWMDEHGVRKNTSQALPERVKGRSSRILRTYVDGRVRLRLMEEKNE